MERKFQTAFSDYIIVVRVLHKSPDESCVDNQRTAGPGNSSPLLRLADVCDAHS